MTLNRIELQELCDGLLNLEQNPTTNYGSNQVEILVAKSECSFTKDSELNYGSIPTNFRLDKESNTYKATVNIEIKRSNIEK